MTTLKIKLNDHIEYIRTLSDLYHVEVALDEALSKMAGAAAAPELFAAFSQHRQVTAEQARRLNTLLRDEIEIIPMSMPGNSVTPLVNEGDHLIEQMERGPARDAALVALARRVEQKEMSLYAAAIHTTQMIGLPASYVRVLAQNRREEEEADQTLAQFQSAQQATGAGEKDPRGF